MTATLEPGEYDMTCGLLSNPKGKIIVQAADGVAAVKTDAMALVGPIAEYKIYVMQEVKQLVEQTKAFTDAVKKAIWQRHKNFMLQRVSIMNVSNRLQNCSPISMAALMRVKTTTNKRPKILISPVSTV